MSNIKQDWHPADVVAALKKRGTSLAALSRSAGLSSSTLNNALNRPWIKGEIIIAQALEMKPEDIWPSRYFNPITNKTLIRKMRKTTNDLQKESDRCSIINATKSK